MIFNSLYMVSRASGLRVNSGASTLAGKRVGLSGEVNALKKDQRALGGPRAGQPARSLPALVASETPDCNGAGPTSPVPSYLA